jgi:hypothetical protein
MEPLLFSCANMSYLHSAAPAKNRPNRAYSRSGFCIRGGEIQSVRSSLPGSSRAKLRKHEQIRERVWHPPEGWEVLPGRYARCACQPFFVPTPHACTAYCHPRTQPCLLRSSTWRRRSTPFTEHPKGPRITQWPLTHIGVPSKNSMLVLVANWCVTFTQSPPLAFRDS